MHEAYLKLAGSEGLELKDRGHLLAVAVCAMRQVLVDRARARFRQKRGSGQAVGASRRCARGRGFDGVPHRPGPRLARLAERDPQLVRVFECRYFGGLSEGETAEALGLSLRTTQRAWMRARAWLRAGLEAEATQGMLERDDWARLDTLLAEALDRPEAEREAFLDGRAATTGSSAEAPRPAAGADRRHGHPPARGGRLAGPVFEDLAERAGGGRSGRP